ncbi:hypothetical protein IWZ01DRAFT_244625 [Phyllosticta capitalensis]
MLSRAFFLLCVCLHTPGAPCNTFANLSLSFPLWLGTDWYGWLLALLSTPLRSAVPHMNIRPTSPLTSRPDPSGLNALPRSFLVFCSPIHLLSPHRSSSRCL